MTFIHQKEKNGKIYPEIRDLHVYGTDRFDLCMWPLGV